VLLGKVKKTGTPCNPFLEGSRVPGIVSWLSDPLTCSAFSPFFDEAMAVRALALLLRSSPMTVAGPLRICTAFRCPWNKQRTSFIRQLSRIVKPGYDARREQPVGHE
jgi:hypothetical protein